MNANHPRTSGEAFAVERLRENPNLEYEQLRREAEEAGIVMQPIQYGRARRRLGLTGNPSNPSPTPSAATTPAAPVAPAAPEPTPPTTADPAPTPPTAAKVAVTDSPAPTQPSSTPTPRPQTLKKPSTPAFEFLVETLQVEPTISYADLKARADMRGLKIAPIMYGRAKALLGLVPVAPRGQGKNRKRPATVDVRSLPPAEAASLEQFRQQLERVRDLDALVAITCNLEEERRRLQAVLQQIAGTLNRELNT